MSKYRVTIKPDLNIGDIVQWIDVSRFNQKYIKYKAEDYSFVTRVYRRAGYWYICGFNYNGFKFIGMSPVRFQKVNNLNTIPINQRIKLIKYKLTGAPDMLG